MSATEEHKNDDDASEAGGYDFAARLTGIKVTTLYSMVHQKRIPHVRVSKRMVRFVRADVQAWMEERKVPVQ